MKVRRELAILNPTTIRLDREVKERIASQKDEGETFNTYFKRCFKSR